MASKYGTVSPLALVKDLESEKGSILSPISHSGPGSLKVFGATLPSSPACVMLEEWVKKVSCGLQFALLAS